MSSSGGNGGPAKAEKLTAEISKDISNFVTNERAFGELISGSLSGDNSFSTSTSKEMRDNCKLISLMERKAYSYRLEGSQCPVLADIKDTFKKIHQKAN